MRSRDLLLAAALLTVAFHLGRITAPAPPPSADVNATPAAVRNEIERSGTDSITMTQSALANRSPSASETLRLPPGISSLSPLDIDRLLTLIPFQKLRRHVWDVQGTIDRDVFDKRFEPSAYWEARDKREQDEELQRLDLETRGMDGAWLARTTARLDSGEVPVELRLIVKGSNVEGEPPPGLAAGETRSLDLEVFFEFPTAPVKVPYFASASLLRKDDARMYLAWDVSNDQLADISHIAVPMPVGGGAPAPIELLSVKERRWVKHGESLRWNPVAN